MLATKAAVPPDTMDPQLNTFCRMKKHVTGAMIMAAVKKMSLRTTVLVSSARRTHVPSNSTYNGTSGLVVAGALSAILIKIKYQRYLHLQSSI